MIVIESALNRLRGTGDVFSISNFRITGIMLYTLYLMVVISLVTEWYYALAFGVLFVAGESYSWGKWIGFLVDYENKHEPEYDSKVGKGFPYIHYIADVFAPETRNYKLYCQTALAIRGFFWFAPIYGLLYYIGLINTTETIALITILSIGFPIACYIGRNWDYNNKIGVLEFKRGWENQEIAYGTIQGLCLWYVIMGVIYVG